MNSRLLSFHSTLSQLLAFALADLVPKAAVLEAEASSEVFWVDFHSTSAISSEIVTHIEERVRFFLTHPSQWEVKEMMPASALGYLRSIGTGSGEWEIAEEGLLTVCRYDHRARISPLPLEHNLESFSSYVFKLFPVLIFGEGRMRIWGKAAEERELLKILVKEQKTHPLVHHWILARKECYFEEQGRQVFLTLKGDLLLTKVKKLLDRHLAKENFYLYQPLRINHEADEFLATLPPLHPEGRYFLRKVPALSSPQDEKDFDLSVLIQEPHYQSWVWGTSATADESTRKYLHLIQEILTILPLKFHWSYEVERPFGGKSPRQAGQILQKAAVDVCGSLSGKTGSAVVGWVQDGFGRKFPWGRVAIFAPTPFSEKFAVVATFGENLGGVLAALLEKTGGELPEEREK